MKLDRDSYETFILSIHYEASFRMEQNLSKHWSLGFCCRKYEYVQVTTNLGALLFSLQDCFS